LHIADPVLVGHSIAGEELSAISTYHPGRAAALIYLEATGTFALYNPKHGDYKPALAQLKDDLSELQKNLFDDGLMSKTLTDMALCQANLANLQAEVEGATGPSPKASDLASISAFQSYVKGYYGGIIPESEVRQNFRIGEDGRVGEFLGHGYASQSVMLEEERFHSIDTPLLAILSYPSAPYPSQTSDPAKLAAHRTAGTARIEAQSLRFCFAFFDLGERYGVARTAQRECCWATVTAPSRRRRPTVPVGPFHTRWFGVLLNNVRTPTSTSLASSLNPTVYGQTVEVTATVTSDSGMPTGTVQILNGTTVVGSGTLASGKVSIPVSTLPAGTDSITASYLGGGDFAPSKSSPITQTVTKAPTATSVASSLNPGGTNQALTFTAAVSSQYGGATTGTVTFMAGAQNLGSAALSGNIASLVT
jgi:hypothetical protein